MRKQNVSDTKNSSSNGKVSYSMKQVLVRVQSVESREEYTVTIHFTDGSRREVNLDPYLHGPIFEPIRNDPALFRAMQVEEGTIAWPNGADIDPDVLYYGLTPAWAMHSETPEDEGEGQLL
jgi:hypothetical protein